MSEESGDRDGRLDALFCPDSVTVIGASRSEEKIGHAVLKNIVDSGFGGEIYPVNPEAEKILGRRAYGSVKDVPGALDLAVIVLPAEIVVDEIGRAHV